MDLFALGAEDGDQLHWVEYEAFPVLPSAAAVGLTGCVLKLRRLLAMAAVALLAVALGVVLAGPTVQAAPDLTPLQKFGAVLPGPAQVVPDLTPFQKLGAWVDVYDYAALDAWQATGVMKQKGVRTIYLQTGRWNSPNASNTAEFADKAKVDWWVHSAHARGMKVVGWYLPAYDDMERDVRRTVMIWTYRTDRGQRFDGVGIDIEYKGRVPSASAWNRAVLEHAKEVRRRLGAGAPIAAITPAPLGMAIRPQDWSGFPWTGLAGQANVFMPMGYWSYRTDCASNPRHCSYDYTKGNVTETRRLTGKPNVPVHVIGGVGDRVTVQQVDDYVTAAREVRAYGGSLYDYRTTENSFWVPLANLNR
ncbi:MAG: hypothetical protein M3O70_18570 [Actinomycetota bacterium]|nr:hypothetical protein [Actinomycetota bacterium]